MNKIWIINYNQHGCDCDKWGCWCIWHQSQCKCTCDEYFYKMFFKKFGEIMLVEKTPVYHGYVYNYIIFLRLDKFLQKWQFVIRQQRQPK